jgi:hypothetical protein
MTHVHLPSLDGA